MLRVRQVVLQPSGLVVVGEHDHACSQASLASEPPLLSDEGFDGILDCLGTIRIARFLHHIVKLTQQPGWKSDPYACNPRQGTSRPNAFASGHKRVN